MKKKPSLLTVFLTVTLLTLSLSAMGVTMAKYTSERKSVGAAVAQPFYFSSDTLREWQEEPLPHYPYLQVDEPEAGQPVPISFTLTNFVDSVRYTKHTTSYRYRVLDSNGQEIEEIGNTGTLAGNGRHSDQINLNVASSAFGSAGEITVIATSTSPYEKTIGATFGFAMAEHALQYTVEDQGDAVVLKLSGASGKPVTVSWTAEMNLTPDKTNAILQGISGTSVTFVAEGGTRYALTFFKEDPSATYSRTDFTVTEGAAA